MTEPMVKLLVILSSYHRVTVSHVVEALWQR
jgi:hypothetical protein